MLSKLKAYFFAALAGMGIILLAFLKGASSANNRMKVKAKEKEIEGLNALSREKEQAETKTRENNEKLNNDDWSGFNR